MTPPTPTRRDRGRMLFWILVVLLLIAGVWYVLLGPGAHGPLIPAIGGSVV